MWSTIPRICWCATESPSLDQYQSAAKNEKVRYQTFGHLSVPIKVRRVNPMVI
jgi:hypothetical protein